uniref:Ankyrin repeat-containing domain n=1 Tax=Globisporangium ultimum (strain ATCC 200006 / CBS 805.95 / DAOM BR144) TaxID=431595 RepID=K3X9A0_GLOUD
MAERGRSSTRSMAIGCGSRRSRVLDAQPPATILHCAAAHECFHAVYALRKTSIIMAWVDTFRLCTFLREVMWEAAHRGDLTVVRWLHTTTKYEPHVAMEFAARGGQLEIAKWLADNVRTSLDFQRHK